MMRRPPRSPLFPSTTLFRSGDLAVRADVDAERRDLADVAHRLEELGALRIEHRHANYGAGFGQADRKSTRLNSSHLVISYAVFCLKKKTNRHLAFHLTCARR